MCLSVTKCLPPFLVLLFSCISLIYISSSEYLVRNRVQAANQQDLVLQGLKCVSCKTCSVYCTSVCRVHCWRCAMCIVQGVQCVIYRVCIENFTLKSSVNNWRFQIQDNLLFNPQLGKKSPIGVKQILKLGYFPHLWCIMFVVWQTLMEY